MKKRLGALILAMLMVISIYPVAVLAAAPEATSTASAYDVRIEGNFMSGLSITANYDYAPGADGCDNIPEDAYFIWYRRDNVEETSSTVILKQGYYKDGANVYTLQDADCNATENDGAGLRKAFYVSVQTKNENGWGEPVFSGIYGPGFRPLSTTAAYATSHVRGAHIVPKNADGTMELGDTLVARYTYFCQNGNAGQHKFQWFVKDSVSGEARDIEGATTDTYTIGAEAYGKYIGCTITPGNVGRPNDSNNPVVTTMIHYGNPGQKATATATVNAYSWTPYPNNKVLSDGMSRHTATAHSNWFSKGSKTFTYDIGEVVAFDGVFFSMWKSAAASNLKITYSADGDTWKTLVEKASGEDVTGQNEYLLEKTDSARYFKLENTSKDEMVAEFYPFLIQDAVVTVDENVATVSDGVIKVKVAGTSSTALLSELTATSLIDNSALTPVFVDAAGNQINESFVIDAETTAKLKVTGKNGAVIEYGLALEQAGENLTLNCNEEIVSLSGGKLVVAGYGTPSSAIQAAVTATSAVNGATLNPTFVDGEGNVIAEAFKVDENIAGKYVRFTNVLGDNYDYELYYSNLISTVGATEENDNALIPVTSFRANTNGKFLVSAQLYLSGTETGIRYFAGAGTSDAAYALDFLKFKADGSIWFNDETKAAFKYTPEKWYDIEVLFDYSTYTVDGAGYMNSSIWIDGVLIGEPVISFGRGSAFNRDQVRVATNTGVRQKNVTFRQMYANENIAENNYALTLTNGGVAVNGPLAAGTQYTLGNNIGVYMGTATSFLAVYDVTYDGDDVVSSVLANVVMGAAPVVQISAPVTNADNTVTKQEVKAFCFSDTLVPIVRMAEWK